MSIGAVIRSILVGDAASPADVTNILLNNAAGVATANPMGCSCGDETRRGRDASRTPDGSIPPPRDGGDGGGPRRPDAGRRDAGPRDAGRRDSGTRDAGRCDACVRDGGRDGGSAPDAGDGGPHVVLCPDGSEQDNIGQPCVHNDCPDQTPQDDIRDPCNHADALRTGYADRVDGVSHDYRIDDSFALWSGVYASDITFYGNHLYLLAPAGGNLANNSILTFDICQAERTLNADGQWALPNSFHSDFWNRDDTILPQQMTLPQNDGPVFHITSNNAFYEVMRATGSAVVIPFELMGLHGGAGLPADPPNGAAGACVTGGRLYATLAMQDRNFAYQDGKVLRCGLTANGVVIGDSLAGGIKQATDCHFVAGNVGKNPTGLACPPDPGTFLYAVASGTFGEGTPPADARLAAIQRSSDAVATTTGIGSGTADIAARVARVDDRHLLVLGSADDTARVFLKNYANFSIPTDERQLFLPMGVAAVITGIKTVAGPSSDMTFYASDTNEGVVFIRRIDDRTFTDEVDLRAPNQLGPSVLINAQDAAFACGKPVFDTPWAIVYVVAGGLVLLQPAP